MNIGKALDKLLDQRNDLMNALKEIIKLKPGMWKTAQEIARKAINKIEKEKEK